MTKELRRISILVLVMFLALFGSVSWIQVVQADSLAQNDANTRTRLDSYEIQRGSIIAGGAPIATSVPSNDMYSFQRVYTDPQMWSAVTGYYNPALGSATGIEKAMNSELSGTGGSQFLSSIERIVSGQPQKGANVVLSLDPKAQKAAYDALQRLPGRGRRDRAEDRPDPRDGLHPGLRHATRSPCTTPTRPTRPTTPCRTMRATRSTTGASPAT